MRSIVHYFIHNSIAGNLLMVGIFLAGLFGLMNMKSTFFPEEDSRFLSVRIIYPGASPEEIEEGIVNKIEENLKGLVGIERVTSVSSENGGSISIEVQKEYNADVVLQDVKNAIDQIPSFPVGMEPVVAYKVENIGFAYSFAIGGDVDLRTLKQFARQAEDDLRSVEGISQIELTGFPDEEIEIAFREQDLRAYQLTFDQATQAVRAANIELTGGTIKGEKEELLLRSRNKGYYAKDLMDIVVKTNPSGSVIYLHQIANVTGQVVR